jgi:hypothetical protein
MQPIWTRRHIVAFCCGILLKIGLLNICSCIYLTAGTFNVVPGLIAFIRELLSGVVALGSTLVESSDEETPQGESPAGFGLP